MTSNTPSPYFDPQRSAIVFALREQLYDRGYNFASFARQFGYSRHHVDYVAWFHWRQEKLPRGLISRRIIRDLQRVLDQSDNGQQANDAEMSHGLPQTDTTDDVLC